MDLRGGLLFVLLALTLSASGCAEMVALIEDPESIVFTVPDLRLGDEWVVGSVDVQSRVFEHRYSTKVAEQAVPYPDAFGVPVPAIEVRQGPAANDPGTWQHRVQHELGGGNVLARDGHHHMGTHACVASGTPLQATIVRRPADIAFVDYPRSPIPHGFGQPYGKTFRTGELLTETAPLDAFSPGGGSEGATMKFVYEVLGRATIEPLAFGDGKPLDVVVVRSTFTYASNEPGSVQLWFLAEGIPVPVRTTHAPEHPRRANDLELVSYDAGTEPVPFGDAPVTKQFAGPSSGAPRFPVSPEPPMADLDVRFPFDEAVQALGTHPRGLDMSLWLDEHPDAVAIRGSYLRDEDADVYRWELTFQHDRDIRSAHVERTFVNGLAIDDVDSVGTGRSSSGITPIGDVMLTDMASALRVATAFDPRLDDWGLLSWDFHSYGHDEQAWSSFLYRFATPSTSSQPSSVPFVHDEVTAYDWGPSIDALAGGHGPSRGGLADCTKRTVVRPPL